LTWELARSAAALRQWTGAPACAFSAPFGRTDQRLRLLADQCGYRVGFSAEARVADTSGDDILNLPRIEVRGDFNLQEFVGYLEARK
jgi:peptidoglycan/xylan/chitin deacetylase (PgdA/CDA1 family)